MYIGVELLGHTVLVFEFSVKPPWFSTVTASVYICTNRIQGFSWNQFTWLKSRCCQDCIPSVGWREVFISCFFSVSRGFLSSLASSLTSFLPLLLSLHMPPSYKHSPDYIRPFWIFKIILPFQYL